MIKNLSHAALSVSDMERSLTFYRDFLGMKLLMDLDIADDRMSRVLGLPDVKCRIVHLQLGQTVLELFEYHQPKGKNLAREMRQCDRGLIHIGFEVDHFHDHVNQLKEKQIDILGEPVEFRPGVWVIYFRGPDGEVCEFRQQNDFR